ncbi:MAG TPA: succinyl-diaminopimelate desuccinylase [Acidimicrobiales bacterium]|nr:succinyl-diaminopimelate desuccinylase [Acidimicrobiales bacterium]
MTDLLARTAELVAIASVSRSEAELADLVQSELEGVAALEVTRVEDNVVARTSLGRGRRLVLAGHLDTVPPAGNERPRIDGDVLHGLGSADMKGGLAVMLALARALDAPAVDLTYVFYACEEIAARYSGLLAIERARPDLLVADAAILAEPTGARVEAGCQGVLRVEARLRGLRAHIARPWAGRNAIHRLGPLLERVAAFAERRPVIDGCEYRETLQAVAVSGGVAGNVVPDEAILALSHRFAPDRDAGVAFDALSSELADVLSPELGDELVVEDSAPAAAPMLGDPLLAALVESSGAPPRAKIAWTDVAFFAARGVPAANFGPGDPLVAHTPGEHVERAELESVYATLARLASTRV